MKKHALLVGVEDYRDKMISRLNFARADATSLGERLSDRCGFDSVRVLADENGEDEPLLVNIVTALRDTSSELREDDLFLFFFAGHGVEKDGHGYLMARDSLQAFPEHGSLSLELLRKTFGHLSAGKRILLLDACRNSPDAGRSDAVNCMGDMISRDIVAAARSKLTGGTTTALLSACRSGQRAYEWPAKGHGVFTQCLVDGIDGAAWQSGKLEFDRLAAYAAGEVRQWSAGNAGLSIPQEPWYERFGDPTAIVLAVEAPQAASGTSARKRQSDAVSTPRAPRAAEPLILRSGEKAWDVDELAALCARNPDDAWWHLEKRDIETWLEQLGETALAKHAAMLRQSSRGKNKWLVPFLRACGQVGISLADRMEKERLALERETATRQKEEKARQAEEARRRTEAQQQRKAKERARAEAEARRRELRRVTKNALLALVVASLLGGATVGVFYGWRAWNEHSRAKSARKARMSVWRDTLRGRITQESGRFEKTLERDGFGAIGFAWRDASLIIGEEEAHFRLEFKVWEEMPKYMPYTKLCMTFNGVVISVLFNERAGSESACPWYSVTFHRPKWRLAACVDDAGTYDLCLAYIQDWEERNPRAVSGPWIAKFGEVTGD